MRVAIINAYQDDIAFFRHFGFDYCTWADPRADVFHFTGGADIGPGLYSHQPIPGTHSSSDRDAKELAAFVEAKRLGIPMTGFCRGAQLLCSLTGGTLYQDVDNHAGRSHPIRDIESGNVFNVLSVHHQVMNPAKDARVLCEGPGIWTYRRYWDPESEMEVADAYPTDREPEVVFFPSIKGLGVQSHPEWMNTDSALVQTFWRYFEELVMEKK